MKRMFFFLTMFVAVFGTGFIVFFPEVDAVEGSIVNSSAPVSVAVETTTTIVETTTTVVETTTTLLRGSSKEVKRCPKFEPLFEQYGLVPVETFSYIAWRESRCRIKAINAIWDEDGNLIYHLNKNKSWDTGLLQINSSWRTVVSEICGAKLGDLTVLHNLDCNLRVAKYLLDNGGLAHWGL